VPPGGDVLDTGEEAERNCEGEDEETVDGEDDEDYSLEVCISEESHDAKKGDEGVDEEPVGKISQPWWTGELLIKTM